MRTTVGILRGGPGSGYDLSLKNGAATLEHISTEAYEPRDIFIDRKGVWHLHGVAVPPEKALHGVDVAFNALYGAYGEGGEVQRLLQQLRVPYTGSNAIASSLSFDKHRTREVAQEIGIKVPHARLVERTPDVSAVAHDLFRSFPLPVVVKPIRGGASVGVTVAHTYHALEHALASAFAHAEAVLVEEFIRGREATVGVIEEFRNEPLYATFPVEIRLPQGEHHFSYEKKYGGGVYAEVPSTFTSQQKDALQDMAKRMHKELGLSHYSRSDFIVAKRGTYFLETNTTPDLHKESFFPEALKAMGTKISDFLHHMLQLARTRYDRT